MIKIYSPDNLIEAQCLKDMLEAKSIVCHIGGAYLSGAVGELPASGLLALYADNNDAGLAKTLIDEYLKAVPILDD